MGTVIEKQGFSLVTYDNVNWYMSITNENTATAKAFMLKNNIKKIQLNYTAGFKQESTDFLEDYSFIDEITILPNASIDISGIHFLENLEKIRIANMVKQGIHFKLFPRLRSCAIFWSTKHKDLFSCTTLRELTVHHYKAEDLSGFGGLADLQRLTIGSSSIRSLNGLEKLQNLKFLSLNYNSKLSSLKGVETIFKTLTKLDVEACKGFTDINVIAELKNLQELGINNCGEIASIKPVAGLKKLKRFDFWETTNVADGDMSPCIGIERVAYQNRRHYNYKNEEIDRINLTKTRRYIWWKFPPPALFLL